MPSDKNVNSLRYGIPHSLCLALCPSPRHLPTSLTGCCCCLLNGQQFIYCPFLLLLAINKSLIVFGRRRWQESIHLGVDSAQQKATLCVCWPTGRGNGRERTGLPKGKQSCRQLFNAFLCGHPCPAPFQAAVNEAPVYSIVSLLSSRLCVRGCVCVSGYECAFSLRCCCYSVFFIFFTFFVGCSLSIDTKQKANWKVSRSHIFIAYFEAPLA